MRQSQVVACHRSSGRWFGDVRRCGGPRVQEQTCCGKGNTSSQR